MAKKGSKKKITVQEFKAWLEGVEEMQPDGWYPNKEQWEIIREKINMIIDTPPPQPKVQNRPQPQRVPPVPVPPPVENLPLPKPAMQPQEPVQQPSLIDQAMKKEEQQQPQLKPSADPKKPIKTPDIEGPYKSSFI